MMKKVKINYDAIADVLYLSFGEPTPSYTEDFAEGVFVRYDFDTDEMTGITIVDFSQRSEQLQSLDLPGDINFYDMVNHLH